MAPTGHALVNLKAKQYLVRRSRHDSQVILSTLPETKIFAAGNGWLRDDHFLLGWPIFRCELLVLGRVVGG